MKRGAAIAVAVAALFAAGEAAACEPIEAGMIFQTPPAAFQAKVTKVRRLWDWRAIFAKSYEAELQLLGPVRSRSVLYQWDEDNHCGREYPVREGQLIVVLLESDPAGAKRKYVEMQGGAGMLTLSQAVEDFGVVIAYPYTDNLSSLRDLLQDYMPYDLREYPMPPPPPEKLDNAPEMTR